MPMLSPQLATRAGPPQGPWEIFGRRETEGTTPPSHGSDEDILLPLNKSRTASLGGITTGNFRPFESSRPAASLFIHNLPRDMTQRELHLMFTFANDYMSSELIREPGRICASVKFRTMGGATAAQAILEHRPDIFGEASSWLKCEIRPTTSSGVSTPTTSQPASNIKSRFLFMNDDPSTPTESIAASSSASSSSAFLPSSPLYTPSASRLFDPLPLPRRPSNGAAFDSDKRPGPPPRRASVPTRPIGELSIQTQHLQQQQQQQQLQHPQSTSHSQQQPHSQSQSLHGQAHSQTQTQTQTHPQTHPQQTTGVHPSSSGQQTPDYGDPTKVVVPFGPGTSKAKAVSIMQNGGRVLPPANPADQNPPCNTLYVGNLPPDTQEDELKDLFSARPGYKRLCFRTKANGPMCFVEFEDEVFAGKALEDLYGFGLSNSVKGGIRLSFSKNPLGVRSRQPQQKYFN